jgi:hypothetical protein
MTPDDVHAIIVLAQRVATALIKEEQRRRGKRISPNDGADYPRTSVGVAKKPPRNLRAGASEMGSGDKD